MDTGKNETITIRQAVDTTISLLGCIAVPRYLNSQIGIPIDQAISNLQACIHAWDMSNDKTEEQKQTQENQEEDKSVNE